MRHGRCSRTSMRATIWPRPWPRAGAFTRRWASTPRRGSCSRKRWPSLKRSVRWTKRCECEACWSPRSPPKTGKPAFQTTYVSRVTLSETSAPPTGLVSASRGQNGGGRGQAWGSPNRFLDLWRDALHLLRHPVGIHGSADHARRDEKQELGLLDLLLGGPEEIAEHGDAVEQRDARADEGALVLNEAAQDEGLVVEEHHRGLGLALGESRGIDGRGLREANLVDLLLDVESYRALFTDARSHREDDARIFVLDRLGDGVARAAARRHRYLLGGDDGHRGRDVDDGLLVLARHDGRARQHVDLVLAGERVQRRDELFGHEREHVEADRQDRPAAEASCARDDARRRKARQGPGRILGVREGELAAAQRPLDAELGVVGESDLGGQHLDEHLAGHTVELLDGVLDVAPETRIGGHDDGIGDLVRDEAEIGGDGGGFAQRSGANRE